VILAEDFSLEDDGSNSTSERFEVRLTGWEHLAVDLSNYSY
jgi:hypothetical protein